MSSRTTFLGHSILLYGVLGALLVLLMLTAGCASRAYAASPSNTIHTYAEAATPEPGQANVVGTGMVTLTPDMATVRVGVRSESRDVGRAVEQNIRTAQAVYDAVKALGVEAKDLQTSNFRVYQTTTGPSNNPREIFVVENTVIITVRDLDALGAIIAAALNAGANQVHGLSFGASNYEQALNEARRKALEDAKAQAQLMADTLGMRLGSPRRVSFGGDAQPVARADMSYKAAPMMEAAAEVPIESGELVVRVQAHVAFDLLEP